MNRSPFAALTATLAALLVLGTAAPALAHDALRASNPAKDGTVTSVEQVTLEFTAKVRMPFVIVRGDGGQFHQGQPVLDGKVVKQAVKGPLADGKYVIAYRVVSSDGHPIEGEIPFTVKGGAKAAATPVAAAPSAPAADKPVQASAERSGGGVTFPIWLIIVVGALAGIGIGFLLSMRNKKP
ncbi:copper resistance CopC family protein [Nonomuraea typhae]|uniref:copper resistance CopC family protein n=1 Tax=Nonomuraea typhae TaxID=2603600 RepID=UPI0012F86092|nr:copper resistance CopC family protein [Nonomuraea typhae]